MPKLQNTAKRSHRPRSGLIKTNFFELFQELSRLTEDDHLVVAAVKKVLVPHRVLAVEMPAPGRLVVAGHCGKRRRSKWK